MMQHEETDNALELLRDLPAELSLQEVDRMVLAFPAVPAANAWYKNINLNSFIMTTAGTLIVAGLTFFLAAKSQVPPVSAATPPVLELVPELAEIPVQEVQPVLQMAEAPAPALVAVKETVPEVKTMETLPMPVAEPTAAMEPMQPVTVETAETLPVAPEPVAVAALAPATQLDLKDFTSVQASGPVNVTIAQGPFSVNVEGDADAMDLVEVTVEKGALKIECAKKEIKKKKDCKCDFDKAPMVVVTMPELRAVGLGGSGMVSIADFDQTGSMDLSIAGSGDIKFSSFKGLAGLNISVAGSGDVNGGKAEVSGKTKISVAGSGDVKIAGRTDNVKVSISGSGDVDASEMEAGTGAASIAGSGSVVVNTKGELTKAVSGSGKVRNTGSGGSGSSSSDEDQQ